MATRCRKLQEKREKDMYEIFLIVGMLACACLVGFVADGLHGEVRLLKRNMTWGSLILKGLSVLLFLCYHM